MLDEGPGAEVGGPLDGVRVVDVSDTFMGPYITLLLAQMGAEVIKVELPEGDITRQIADVTGTGSGPIFLNANRGKKSVLLDLRVESNHELFLALIRECDVFVHNRRPAAANKLRIDYPTLQKVNPRLVYCAAVGFGSHGPYGGRPAYDDVIQAASGMAAVQTGTGEPSYVRTPVADKVTALLAFGSLAAALYERESSGQGQAIEVPMFETMVSFLMLDQQGGFVYDPPAGPTGYARTESPYRRPYRTADGLIGVMVYTDEQWRSFFELVGCSEFADDERFATIGARTENVDPLYSFLEEQLLQRSTDDWLAVLAEREIPVSRVNSLEDLFTDEHIAATGLMTSELHPVAGRVRAVCLPVQFSRTHPKPVGRAPLLGEHTPSVFGS